MRMASFVFGLVVAASVAAAGQQWAEYENTQDGFKANFPGQPKVTETTWKSENDYVLPARVYQAERGRERYTVTVVDYGSIERQGIERAKGCAPGAEPCSGDDRGHGPGYWKHDVNGAVIYATGAMLKRNVTVLELSRAEKRPVVGHELHIVNNIDQSQTFAFVGMLNLKLYIAEGTVPKDYPPPALFINSIEVIR